MDKPGFIGVIGRICGAGFRGCWRAIKTVMGALLVRLPYQAITRTRLNQLEDCEATLKVMIAQIDQRHVQSAGISQSELVR